MAGGLVTLVVVVIAAGAVLAGVVIVVMARLLLRPPRMSDGKAAWVLKRLSPGDLGLHFEPVEYSIRDDRTGRPLRIAGWWIPHAQANGRCVVLLHGYADAKVGAIAWAPMIHALGWNILAVDLRAHGESEGTQSTGGCFERHDVAAVVNALQAERPGGTRRIVLFGVSLGAAVAAATTVLRDDLSGVVLESPFADYREAVSLHADRLGLHDRLLQRAAIRVAQWISGADFGAVRPADLIPRIGCPMLIFVSADDPFVGEGARELEAAVESRRRQGLPTAYCRIEEAGHCFGMHCDPELYRATLEEFLLQTEGSLTLAEKTPMR